MEQRLQKLEERMDRVEDRQHTLETEQAETKVYIKQIFGILDELKITSKNQITKEDLFHFLSEQNKVNSKNLASWQKWTLTIIAGTLFVIVGYFFGH